MDSLEKKGKAMKYVGKCPRCSGQVIEREVTEILSDGINTVFIKINAGVCLHCEEKLYTPETVQRFEEIETKLKHKKNCSFRPVGKSFQVEP